MLNFISRLPAGCLAALALLLSVYGQVSACPEGQHEACVNGTCICVPDRGSAYVKPEPAADKNKKDPGRLIVNPDGGIDSIGTPTLADIFEFIDKNPDKAMELIQDSAQWPYLTVAAGIIACHDAVMVGGGKPIPDHLRKTLRRWYPDEMLDAVRWTTLRESIRGFLQNAHINFDEDTLAVTVMDAVIFRTEDLAGDGALWAHELYHVRQYRQWGVFGFAKRWLDNASITGPVEAPAYAREAEARRFFAPHRSKETSPGTTRK